MTYVIGDIHGEYEKLLALLGHIPSTEKLVFIGDYINKGSEAKQTMDLLLDLSTKRKCVFLLGNHEFKLLQAWEGNEQAIDYLEHFGFKETIEGYLETKLTKENFKTILDSGKFKNILFQHYDFIKNLKMNYSEGEYLIVHAGIPLDENGEFTLASLERMLFVREEFINCKKKFNGKVVIFGHTAFKQVFWDGYKLGIDTGAVYSKKNGYGRLTAVNLDTFVCIDNEGKMQAPIINNNTNIFLDRRGWREIC